MAPSSYVVKVEHKGSIRRFTVEEDFEFLYIDAYKKLQIRIRELFQLPSSDQFVLTYIDNDGDVVTMGEDDDLKDALVVQALNPLRVTIANVQGDTDVKTSSPIPEQEANSDEVTQQQQQPVAEAEPVVNSGEQVANAKPVINSGETSTSPEGKPSHIDEAPISNLNAASPASSGPVGDVKEAAKEEWATEKKSAETEGAKEEDGVRQIHFGIRCDGCGMIPISGPRFKSCRKPDYDLCANCFETSGAEENEYAKIERLFYRVGYPPYGGMFGRRHPHHRMGRKPDQCPKNSTVDPNSCATAAAGAGAAEAGAKTTRKENSRAKSPRDFHRGVQCDECGMVPIEGPRFKSSTRFNYDLCHICFEKSGSNASEYSRLDRPVVRGGYPLVMSQMLRRTPPHCRLNPRTTRWFLAVNQLVPIIGLDGAEWEERAPAAGGDAVKVGGVQPQAESAAGESTSTATSAAKVNPVSTPPAPKQEGGTEEKSVDANVEGKDVQIPVTDTKEGDLDTGSPSEARTPVVEVGNASTANDSGTTAGVEAAVQAPPAAEGDLSTREGLLAKLATMGFEDPKLNEELLEKNSFDLRKTLDDLCAAEEWDPILGELQEMGFYDANVNRRLMFKNKGSVKRVVKELVQMYKGETKA